MQDTKTGDKREHKELVIVSVKNTIPLIIITIYGLIYYYYKYIYYDKNSSREGGYNNSFIKK